MSDKIPPSWFDHDAKAREVDEARRRKQLEAELPGLLERREHKDRAHSFYPYLLARSVLGDRGDRPINVPFWESPDIWTAPGDPSISPPVPATHGGTVTAGQPNTVYAHVWNLGFAPLAGVRVEFSWFNPSLAIDGAHAHPIGVARCELAGRGMQGSHKLVKCPTPWVPVIDNGGHECLVVRVSGVGDPLGNNEWQPWMNRHVAQRNISVVAAGAVVQNLVTTLNLSRRIQAHLQLIQLGAREGELAARLVAPALRVAPLETRLLGEVTVHNEIVLRRTSEPSAGMLTPVHPKAHPMSDAPTAAARERATAHVIEPMQLLRGIQPLRSNEAAPAHLSDLLASVGQLHGGPKVGRPAPGQAFVMRMASYDAEQLIGGYTLVVAGGE